MTFMQRLVCQRITNSPLCRGVARCAAGAWMCCRVAIMTG